MEIGAQAPVASTSFTPFRSQLSLDYQTRIANSGSSTSLEIYSNQVLGSDGQLVSMAESNFPPNQLRATFNNNSGDLFVDWLGANPQQNGIGTEMLSRAVERYGVKRPVQDAVAGRLRLSSLGPRM